MAGQWIESGAPGPNYRDPDEQEHCNRWFDIDHHSLRHSFWETSTIQVIYLPNSSIGRSICVSSLQLRGVAIQSTADLVDTTLDSRDLLLQLLRSMVEVSSALTASQLESRFSPRQQSSNHGSGVFE
jgi:hypothetical protein